MCVVIPDCTSCKNYKGKNKNGLFYCSAFPQGIPKKYFWGNIPVRNISECAIKSGLKKLMISIENNYFINFLQTVDFTAKI